MRANRTMSLVADSFNRGANVQYGHGYLPHSAHVMNNKTDENVIIDLNRPASIALAKRHAPAMGCFGFTRAHLVEPRACQMDAELFARFYAEPDASSRLVTKAPPKLL